MNLLILEQRADEYKKALSPKFPEVVIHAAAQEAQVGKFIEEADILMTIRISDDLIKKASKLKWVHAMTTGVDYIVNLPSLRKEIILTSTRGIHGPQVSEMAFLLMLALNRNFPEVVRNQDKGVWERWQGKLLWKKKLGILGVGVIGEEIAKKGKAFGMEVFGIDIIKRKLDCVDAFYGPEDIVKVAKEVDYLVIVAPNTRETEKIVDSKVLSAMKPTAFVLNLGRGELVDEEALIRALKSGKIAGAGLDTYLQEPLPKGHPFWGMKNVIVSPHVAGMSDIYVEQAVTIFEENLRRFVKGERRNLINLVER
ncbi:MAG TPA: D-2-hydroxyacid dehydrogenase [Thermodesulfobacteriota bacterium]|nr:D-2-hydroxyacid dehydrogenase [Thermodesulfobacteriota bacterium]